MISRNEKRNYFVWNMYKKKCRGDNFLMIKERIGDCAVFHAKNFHFPGLLRTSRIFIQGIWKNWKIERFLKFEMMRKKRAF